MSVPVVFQPIATQIRDQRLTLIDGGTYANMQLSEPIDRCREEVTNDEDIIVDVIFCSWHAHIPNWE